MQMNQLTQINTGPGPDTGAATITCIVIHAAGTCSAVCALRDRDVAATAMSKISNLLFVNFMGSSVSPPFVSNQIGGFIGETKVKIQPGRVGGTAFAVAVRSDNCCGIPVEPCFLAIVGKV